MTGPAVTRAEKSATTGDPADMTAEWTVTTGKVVPVGTGPKGLLGTGMGHTDHGRAMTAGGRIWGIARMSTGD